MNIANHIFETPPNKGIAKANKARKREEAEARQAAYEGLTPQQHLDVLIERGYGHTAEADGWRDVIAAIFEK